MWKNRKSMASTTVYQCCEGKALLMYIYVSVGSWIKHSRPT